MKTTALQACFAASLLLLTACGGGGGGSGGTAAPAPTPTPPPTAGDTNPPMPASITVPSSSTPTQSTSATISWAASTGATRYELQRREGAADAWSANLLSSSSTTTSYTQTGLADGDSYQYQVRACNASGCSGWQDAGTGGATAVFTAHIDSDGDGTRDMDDSFPDIGARDEFVGAVGSTSISTCNIDAASAAMPPSADDCSRRTGKMRVNDVELAPNQYLNFLMVGGDGRAEVGIKLYAAGTTNELADYKPNTCQPSSGERGPMFVDATDDEHWRHFVVNSLMHGGSPVTSVDIEIYDDAATGACGFVAFDHIYLGAASKGSRVP